MTDGLKSFPLLPIPKSAKKSARIKNDYVFALIGGEKPTKFLESIGVKIG